MLERDAHGLEGNAGRKERDAGPGLGREPHQQPAGTGEQYAQRSSQATVFDEHGVTPVQSGLEPISIVGA